MYGRGRVDYDNLFIEVYSAFPASVMGREDIDCSNSIILPPSALKRLSSMKNFGDSRNPILFRILNIELNLYTHCGVVEFTAEEDTCYIPSNMFERLCLAEGQKVNLRATPLEPGTFIKLQPHKTEFINLPNPKTILEYNLRNYFCVSEGDTIAVKFGKNIYHIDVLECKPKKFIRTLNCDINVDFAPPKDYKEPSRQKRTTASSSSGGLVKFNSKEIPAKLTEEEIKKQIEDQKFSGHHIRMDGKAITGTQIKKIKENRKVENKEENYDPRKCRIPSEPRPEFKYVEL